MKRLSALTLIKKFISKFLQDKSFENLCGEIQSGNRRGAFHAAHTLKGVCANLCFDRLLASAGQLTELLRPETGTIPGDAALLLETVAQDYEETVSAIRAYLDDDAS